MTQRKRWLKTREFEKGECVAVRRPGKANRNAKTTTVCLCFGLGLLCAPVPLAHSMNQVGCPWAIRGWAMASWDPFCGEWM